MNDGLSPVTEIRREQKAIAQAANSKDTDFDPFIVLVGDVVACVVTSSRIYKGRQQILCGKVLAHHRHPEGTNLPSYDIDLKWRIIATPEGWVYYDERNWGKGFVNRPGSRFFSESSSTPKRERSPSAHLVNQYVDITPEELVQSLTGVPLVKFMDKLGKPLGGKIQLAKTNGYSTIGGKPKPQNPEMVAMYKSLTPLAAIERVERVAKKFNLDPYEAALKIKESGGVVPRYAVKQLALRG